MPSDFEREVRQHEAEQHAQDCRLFRTHKYKEMGLDQEGAYQDLPARSRAQLVGGDYQSPAEAERVRQIIFEHELVELLLERYDAPQAMDGYFSADSRHRRLTFDLWHARFPQFPARLLTVQFVGVADYFDPEGLFVNFHRHPFYESLRRARDEYRQRLEPGQTELPVAILVPWKRTTQRALACHTFDCRREKNGQRFGAVDGQTFAFLETLTSLLAVIDRRVKPRTWCD